MKSWLVAVLGAFAVLGCQPVQQTLADTDEVGKAVADKGGFLYEITPNAEGAAPFYLFGVIHYDKYFAPQETHLMIKPSGWSRILKADRTFVEEVAPRHKCCAPVAEPAPVAKADGDLKEASKKGAAELQPRYADCGFSMDGADAQTAWIAQKAGKRINGLETAEDRQRIFGRMSAEEREKSAAFQQLNHAVGSLAVARDAGDDDECRGIEETWLAWKSENVAAVEAQLAAVASADPVFTRYGIDERSALFHQRITRHLQEKGAIFVAVGALHLYGERGLLALFKADGYTVNWVP
jgi:uncharacterized protein YbaP (TraB family)